MLNERRRCCMNTAEITLHCSNGFTLRVKGSNLAVERKRTEELFPIPKIQSFSLKEPRGLSMGQITFRTAQAASAGLGLGFGISAAIGAEQTYFFAKSEMETALQIRDYISNYTEPNIPPQPSEGKVVSVVEEIRGLKSLLDDGILTQDEFDAKKRQLLGV